MDGARQKRSNTQYYFTSCIRSIHTGQLEQRQYCMDPCKYDIVRCTAGNTLSLADRHVAQYLQQRNAQRYFASFIPRASPLRAISMPLASRLSSFVRRLLARIGLYCPLSTAHIVSLRGPLYREHDRFADT